LLDVAVDPKAKTFAGTVTQRLKVVAPNQKRLKLDQIGLDIQDVKLGGEKAKFSVEGQVLFVELPKAPNPGDTLELAIRYATVNPRRGIYFTGPDADYPNKRYQVWSQGQDEDT